MNYEQLTTEQRAEFIASLIDGGLYNYFDRCTKQEDGNYAYYCADTDEALVRTPEELVSGAEQHGKEEILEYWEVSKGI